MIVKVFGPVHGPEAPASFREVRLTTTHGFGLSVAVEHLGVWMVPDSERGEVARNLQCLCDAVARGDGMPVDKRESDEAGRTGTCCGHDTKLPISLSKPSISGAEGPRFRKAPSSTWLTAPPEAWFG